MVGCFDVNWRIHISSANILDGSYKITPLIFKGKACMQILYVHEVVVAWSLPPALCESYLSFP